MQSIDDALQEKYSAVDDAASSTPEYFSSKKQTFCILFIRSLKKL